MGRAAVVTGIGSALPDRVVTNDMLAARMDTSDEWIRTRTGIRERRVVDPGTATSDLAVAAGERALKSAGVDGVDAVVLATTTPDHPCPATAPAVAARLGLGTVAAYDVAAVCSGFLYGLASAGGLIATGLAERVLMIGAEAFTTIIDQGDRNTAPIFGDGAGAVVLTAGEQSQRGALLGFDLGSDGALADLIIVPSGGSRDKDGTRRHMDMRGKAVFVQAVQRMTESSRTVLARTGWSADTVDWLVGHQANARILHAVAEHLGLAQEKAFVNVGKYGNTAGASIPIALADAAGAGLITPGDRVLLTAFGGGATWGAVTLEWPDITPG
ncbi:beta-ketoacyl-ACP synthase III [Saccharothrix stipae]